MDHSDHVNLLKPAKLPPGGTWADLGAGEGAFTLALRELVGPTAGVYAVDRDRGRLRELERAYLERFGSTENLHPMGKDFSGALDLPPLDGVVMANSLHFFKDPEPDTDGRGRRGERDSQIRVPRRTSASHIPDQLTILRHVRTFLKPDGLLLLVEYNVDHGNLWVPHPFSFETYQGMAPRAGFTKPRLLAKHPSSFLREFYSALAKKG